MIPPNPARAVCPASAALPKLTRAQANALRLADRDGGLRWSVTRACWGWGHPGVGVRVICQATVKALTHRKIVKLVQGGDCLAFHPSDVGCAWLAANPDGKA